MYKNYFKTAIRTLWRNPLFSSINVLGLSLGLASCILIVLYAKDELSFDLFHHRVNDIYRVVVNFTSPEGKSTNKTSSTGMIHGPTFASQIPEIESMVRIQSNRFTIRHGRDIIDEEILYTDDNFFKAFNVPLVAGDPKTALTDIHSVVLSEEMAKKYFGNTDAIGKTIEVNINDTFQPFRVAAVAKNSPQNSSIKIRMLFPINFEKPDNQFLNFFLNTFFVLRPGADPNAVVKKMASAFQSAAANDIKEGEKFGFKDKISFDLQPIKAMHLSTDFPPDNGLVDGSNPIYSYILSGIALLLLVIACINFINLTIARSLKRAKEIGIRKVVGGQRIQLAIQFLGESFVLCIIAFLLGIGLVELVLPFFNTISNKALAFSYLFDVKLILGLVALFLVTGLMAGFYPALVLSGFNPVKSLYGRHLLAGKGYISRALVVLQFTLATFLIIATITIRSQFNFLTHFELGYDENNVVQIMGASPMDKARLDLVRAELMKDPSVANVSGDQGGRWGTMAHINGDRQIEFDIRRVDENLLPLFEIKLIKGRNFSANEPTDSSNFILVNEAFVKEAGWKDPLGKEVDFFYKNKKYKVLGVMKDFHFRPLTEKIGPLLLSMQPDVKFRELYVRLQPGYGKASLGNIEKVFRQFFPSNAYSLVYRVDASRERYNDEAKWKQIMSFGAILTIFISCIGLFGLATLAAEKRRKEIGIRKVLGASVTIIVRKLSIDFLRLVVLAVVIALPIAWWALNKWLENYPYRVAISWWIFALALVLVVTIALLTISFQSIRAAIANPVKSLRSE